MSDALRLVIVGGSDAGISAGLRARELDPAIRPTLVLADAYPNFSICGLPYWLSGEVRERQELAHRTREDLERAGLNLRLDTVASRIDVERRELNVRTPDGRQETIEYDRLVIATGAVPARPPIPGIELPRVHMLHTMGDASAVQDALNAGARSAVIIGAGASSKTVKLAGQPNGTFTGTANIPLSNSSKTNVNATVVYYGQRPPNLVKVAARPVSVPPGATAVLALTAAVAPPAVPSDLNGTVVINERDANGQTLGTLPLAVQGTLVIPTDVAFEPADITVQVTRDQGLSQTTAGATPKVRLRGPGVRQLVDTLDALAAKGEANTLLLADGDGQETRVQFSEPKFIGPGLAEATICVQGTEHCGTGPPSVGAYTGTLSLSPGESGAPTLKVTVNSHLWLFYPILFVAIGALFGGLLPTLTANARAKSTLGDTLRESLLAYENVLPSDPTDRAAWDMTPVLGERKDWFTKRWTGLPGATGVGPLWSNIHADTSDEDLAQDAAAIATLSAQLKVWTDAQRLAAGARQTEEHPAAGARRTSLGGHAGSRRHRHSAR